jgi:transcriptional regulator with XRE-family HTH domain
MTQKLDSILLKKVATVLKEIRLQNGLTQSDVYYDLGIHIGRIESFKTNITLTTLELICNYYEISFIEFFKKIEKA